MSVEHGARDSAIVNVGDALSPVQVGGVLPRTNLLLP